MDELVEATEQAYSARFGPDLRNQIRENFDAQLADRGSSIRGSVGAAMAVLVDWLSEVERDQGFTEAVLGFAQPRVDHREFASSSMVISCAAADDAIADVVARAQETLEAEAALDVEQNAVHAREVVIPLLAARASVLVATEHGNSKQREVLLRRARDTARVAEPVSAWAEAQRGAVIAGASYLLKDDRAAIDAADAAMRSAAEGEGAEAVPTGIALEAALIATAASARSEGYEPARRWLARVERRKDMLPRGIGARLALADAEFLTAKRGADEAVNQNDRLRLLSEAFRAYEPVVGWEEEDRQAQNWARERAWWHAHHASRTADFPFERLPLIAVTANGRSFATRSEAARRESRRLHSVLGHAMAREDTVDQPREVRAEALSVLAGLAWRSGDLEAWREAPLLYLRLSEEFGNDGRETFGLQRALLSVSELVKAFPSDPTARAVYIETLRRVHEWPGGHSVQDRARRDLVRALAEAGAKQGDSDAAIEAVEVASSIVDEKEIEEAWTDACWGLGEVLRVVRERRDELRGAVLAERLLSAVNDAERAIGELTPALAVYRASALLALGRTDDASAIVDRFGPIWRAESALAADGLEVEVRARVGGGDQERAAEAARALRANDEARARAVVGELADRAWSEIEPFTRRLDPCPNGKPCATPAQAAALCLVRSLGLSSSADTLTREGWALLLARDTEGALRVFYGLGVPAVDRPSVLFQMGKAEAVLANGTDLPAFGEFRLVADEAGLADPGGRDFWRAWTRMLEILARQNTDGSRTETIEREIARLRAMPSAPQNPDCLARLAEIEQSINRSKGR